METDAKSRQIPLQSESGRLLSPCAPVAQRLEQQTHNLLVRGSNPCGGTNQLASCLTLPSLCCWASSCSTSQWREDGTICLECGDSSPLMIFGTRDRRGIRSGA